MSKATPIHEIYERRARGLGHLMRKYHGEATKEAFDGFAVNEPLYVEQINGGPGQGVTLRYWRKRHMGRNDRQGFVELGNIQPVSPKNMTFGPETTLNSEQISSYGERPLGNHGGFEELTCLASMESAIRQGNSRRIE